MKKYVAGESPASLSDVFKDKIAAFLGLAVEGKFFERCCPIICLTS